MDLWRVAARIESMKALATSLIALAIAAPSAAADGLPLPVDGADDASVGDLDGFYRYAAVSNGGDQTTVLKITANGGQIARSRTIPGELSVPLVAYDGTASGLSADGRTLALIRPRQGFPRETTDLAILDTATLRPTDRVHLDGDFSFDAISPRGDRLYLIHYQDRRDPLDYEVRAYDVDRGRLLSDPVVDPEEPAERMAGFPMARMVSPNGRWAYTLYAGGEETFIHALDTQGATAVCVDLDHVRVRDFYGLGLNLEGASGTLTVLDQGTPKAIVDTRTFSVSEPPSPARQDEVTDPGEGGWIGWAAIGGGRRPGRDARPGALAPPVRGRRRPGCARAFGAIRDRRATRGRPGAGSLSGAGR